jgi:isoaspartyl peptidase/L-asparaginase-like protein (Ntn-hydrolase superfamily)
VECLFAVRTPFVTATWPFGADACAAAWEVLDGGGSALDAVEAGARRVEADPAIDSVGLGGLPDRDGRVTLDASIMTGDGRAGAVAAVAGILHPVTAARRVMEHTPHLLLAGEGARRFALEHGVASRDLLTPQAAAAWQRWRDAEGRRRAPHADGKNHDTIGLVARDASGRMAGACSTSGMAFKLPGRVGDSPIIGAALYVDDDVGAACATGQGEEVLRVAGSFLVVELMRGGAAPDAACRQVVERIVRGHEARGGHAAGLQVGFLAADRSGSIGAWAVRRGFSIAIRDRSGARLVDARHAL